jgi:hypothetical protein
LFSLLRSWPECAPEAWREHCDSCIGSIASERSNMAILMCVLISIRAYEAVMSELREYFEVDDRSRRPCPTAEGVMPLPHIRGTTKVHSLQHNFQSIAIPLLNIVFYK